MPPTGATGEAVLAAAIQAETILRADPKVQLVETTVPGEGDTGASTLSAAFSGRPANSAKMVVRLASDVDLDAYTTKVGTALAPLRTGGFDIAVGQAFGFTSNSLSIIVSAPDSAAVATAADAVIGALRASPDLVNVKSDLVKATPQIDVRVDPNKALGAGLTAAQVAAQVRSALVGSLVTRVQLADGGPIDLYVRLDPARVTSVEALKALPVGTGAKVALSSVADVAEVATQGSITRIDQAPSASITAGITSKDTGGVSQSAQAAVDSLKAAGAIPAGVDVRFSGVTQQQGQAFGGLFNSMAIAVLLVYVMLVLAFNSLITPFVIMFSLPLAAIGVFPALLLTGRAIGVSALIGILMLIGIVVTNAIVLLDLVERLKRHGMSTNQALIEGGKTRVRPILMTAIATILALIPLAAGFNQGSIIAAELGTVVIGGLFSSTFLTLIVVPVVYSLVDGGKDMLGRRRGVPLPEPAAVDHPAAGAARAATSGPAAPA